MNLLFLLTSNGATCKKATRTQKVPSSRGRKNPITVESLKANHIPLTTMKTKLYSFVIVLALFAGVYTVAAQGTDFTYQGQLNNAGGPANGIYDMTYKLWSASSGGIQAGSTFTVTGTPVTNGLFTATIGFGTVFNGSSYWLELAVRTNGVGSYQTLLPRQEVTPAPYAITAENVDGAVPASQLSGTVPTSALSGPYGNALTLNNAGNSYNGTFNGSVSGNGSGLTSLNASQLTTGTVPDARLSGNVALLNANQTFTGVNTFSGPGESLIVNSGPISTSLFTGLSLQYYTSGEGAIMSSYDDGYGYLTFYTKQGSGYPIVEQMQIDQFGGVAIDQQNYNNGVLNDRTTNGVAITFGTTSGEGIASQRTIGVDQYSLEFYTAFVNRMIIMNNGFVGINTTNPAAQLDVESASTAFLAYSVYGLISSTSPGSSSTGVRGQNNGTGPFGIGVWGSQAGSGWGGYFTSVSGIGVNVSGGSGTGVSANGAIGVSTSGTSSALTISSGAIHVSGAGNNTSTAAFIQITAAGNITGNETLINNPLCNGDPNAILFVTHNDNPGGVFHGENNHVVGVFYNISSSEWTIYNEDNTAMTADLAFNVLIIKN
jgi:hypothetical protein